MSFLDPILAPLLALNPFIAIFLVSFLLSILVTVIYKYMTDQELMKTLRGDIKRFQDEIKLLKDNPEKALEIQKKAMEKNMQYMMHSMRPTLITFLPLILIFGWLSANFAYEPIVPGQEFDMIVTFNNNVYGAIEAIPPKTATMTGLVMIEKDAIKPINSKAVSYKFKSDTAGEWDVIFKVNNSTSYKKSVKVDPLKYGEAIKNKNPEGKDIKSIRVNYPKKIVVDIFGWKVGWLGTYIVLSILFSMGLRKVLKIH